MRSGGNHKLKNCIARINQGINDSCQVWQTPSRRAADVLAVPAVETVHAVVRPVALSVSPCVKYSYRQGLRKTQRVYPGPLIVKQIAMGFQLVD
jgi:hypothetical protein